MEGPPGGGFPAETTARGRQTRRIKRYVAKYTPSTRPGALGIDPYVGSIEPGKMADLVLWGPGPSSG